MRGVVNALPAGVLLLLFVGLCVGAVLFGVWLVRRLVPVTREGFDAEVSSQMLGVVGSLFGLLLAFLVVVEFQSFASAQDNASREADGLAQVIRDSRAFAPADRARVSAAAGDYARLVVRDEWPRLRDGHDSARAWAGIDRLYAALQAARPSSPAASAFYTDAVGRLGDVLQARRSRLAAASGGLSPLLGALMIVGALVLLGYAILVGSKRAGFHAIGAASLAVVVAFSLVVLVTLDHPFSGSLAIDSKPFRTGVLAQYVAPAPR
jgi:hypothetical protein